MTIKGQKILRAAGVVIYAGSLVHPACLEFASPAAQLYNSAAMTLEEIIEVMVQGVAEGHVVARLHSGDPSLYGAIQEQMLALEERGIPYEIVPGVSSLLAAAARLGVEYTRPGAQQTVIISRLGGRTPVPETEALASLAQHRASMCLFLSSNRAAEAGRELARGYPPETPVALVQKVSWPEEKVVRGTLADLEGLAREAGIDRTALMLVGDFLCRTGEPSRLYARDFSHGWRRGQE